MEQPKQPEKQAPTPRSLEAPDREKRIREGLERMRRTAEQRLLDDPTLQVR